MAHYQNGHTPYYSQSNNPTSSTQPPSSSRYDHYNAQQQSANSQLRRMPSYNIGDDAGLFGGGSGAQNARTANGSTRYAGQASNYGTEDEQGSYSLANSGHDDISGPRYAHIPSGGSPHVTRDRASSQSNYSYQYSSVASPTQSAYNPQQYALPPTPSQQQLGYNPIAFLIPP